MGRWGHVWLEEYLLGMQKVQGLIAGISRQNWEKAVFEILDNIEQDAEVPLG